MIKTNNLLAIVLTGIFALVPTAVFAAGKTSSGKQMSNVGITKMNHHHRHHKHHKHHHKHYKRVPNAKSLSQQSY